MKRWMAIAVAIAMLAVAVAGCSDDATTTTQSEAAPTETSVAAPSNGEVVELSVGSSGPLLGVMKAFWYNFVQAGLEQSGKVKVNIFESSTTPKSEWDGLLSGRFDLTFGYFADYEGLFPVSQVVSLPLLFPSGTTDKFGKPVGYVWPVWADLYAKYPQISDEFKDVHLLCVLIGGAGNIWTKEPVESIADISGLKLRAGTAIDGKALERLGATPVTVTATEIYGSIERGVIEGSCAAWGGAVAMKTHELCKNVFEISLDYGSSFWVAMSKEAWDRCSPEVQSLIESMFAPENIITAVGSDIYYQDDARAIEAATAAGVTVTKIGDAELAEAQELMQPVWDEWVERVEANGVPGAQILEDVRAMVAGYAK